MNPIFRSKIMLLSAFLILSAGLKAFEMPSKFLIDYKLRYSYTVDSLEKFWKKNGMPQLVLPIRNDVDLYEVTYKGLWLDSTFILAKGALYVPKNQGPSSEMTYCHGTRIGLDQTYGIQDLEQVVCMMHAADGYVAIFPFYYGLGGGEKEHVYQDAWTESMATIYMIKASRELLSAVGKQTTGQLFLTGYSQGGHASLATHKMLESGYFPEVKLTASSPMSGAYDMVGVQSKTMFQNYDQPHYLPYLLISYQYAYNVMPGLDIYSVFKSPYNRLLSEAFKQPRKVDYGYVNSILPKVPAHMVQDSLLELFTKDPNFSFTRKLKENGLAEGWKPKAPLQLCACFGDNEVMYQNTEVAGMKLKGEDNLVVPRIFGKHLSHNPCAPFAILYSKFFFDNFRKGKKHPERIQAGKKMVIAIGISIANKQAKKTLKKTGKVENDALATQRG